MACIPLTSTTLLVLAGRMGAAGAVPDAVNATAVACYEEPVWRSQNLLDLSGAFSRCGPDLVCTAGHPNCKDYCQRDEECERFPLFLCDAETSKCRHKKLFERDAGPDIGAAVLFCVISGLALSAGIGGGGLYVPLLIVILGFSVRQATAISQACLSGGACTALVYNARQRHPSGLKPMIDYDLVLVMGPSLLVGGIIGSALNASAPSWLILVLLTAILSHSTWGALKKAIETRRKENNGSAPRLATGSARLSRNPIERALRLGKPRRYDEFSEKDGNGRRGQEAVGEADAPPQLVGAPAEVSERDASEAQEAPGDMIGGHCSLEERDGETTEKSLSNQTATPPTTPTTGDLPLTGQTSEISLDPRQQVQFPKRRIAMFGLTWVTVLASIFVRGGRATDGLVPFCSVGYWLVAVITAVALGFISLFAATRAIAHATPPGDLGGLEWDVKSARRIMLWSLMAGTLAALCGIGGGMIMGPILLRLGILPQVQSATTATTLFVLSTSTCITFLVAGTAPWDYSLWMAFATGCGAVIGKTVIGWLVKRYQRPSYLMFLLAGVIGTSVVVMFITGLIDVINDFQQNEDMLFRGLCSKDDE